MIRSSRRGFIACTSCAALLTSVPAAAFNLGGQPTAGAGHVGFQGDHAWWDPRGESPRSRFPQLPVSDPPTAEMIDWLLA